MIDEGLQHGLPLPILRLPGPRAPNLREKGEVLLQGLSVYYHYHDYSIITIITIIIIISIITIIIKGGRHAAIFVDP